MGKAKVFLLIGMLLSISLGKDTIMARVKGKYPSNTLEPFSSELFAVRVVAGEVPGLELMDKFAENLDVGMTYEHLWDGSGSLNYLTSPETLTLVSDDAEDAAGGDGARTVQIQGLNGSFDRIGETVILNGLAGVVTTLTYQRVYRMVVLTAGVLGPNVGTLNLNSAASGAQAVMAPTEGSTLMSHFTIPRGFTGIMRHLYLNTGKNDDADGRLRTSEPAGGPFRTRIKLRSSQNDLFHPLNYGLVIKEMSDIVLEVKTSTGGFIVVGGYQLLLKLDGV